MIAYLTYLILKGFSLFINLLPEGLSLWMGRQLGVIGFCLDREHRKVALQNLRIAFGQERSEEELHIIAKNTAINDALLERLFVQSVRLMKIDRKLRHYIVGLKKGGKK